jgi:hypothetical protein
MTKSSEKTTHSCAFSTPNQAYLTLIQPSRLWLKNTASLEKGGLFTPKHATALPVGFKIMPRLNELINNLP